MTERSSRDTPIKRLEMAMQEQLQRYYQERHSKPHSKPHSKQHSEQAQEHYLNILILCKSRSLTDTLSRSKLVSNTDPRIREDVLRVFDQENPHRNLKISMQRVDMRRALQLDG